MNPVPLFIIIVEKSGDTVHIAFKFLHIGNSMISDLG